MTISTPEIYKIQELTPKQKEMIKASIPILEQSGDALTSKFYVQMLTEYPEVKPFFNESHQKLLKQPRILAFALLNYAKNIDDLAPLTAFVNQIVVKHVGLQVKPEHYPIVGKCLLDTMKVLLGEEIATEEFLQAWATAYGNLAQTLINAEDKKYRENPWDGFRDFKVVRLVDESSDVKSVYFTPVDGGKIAPPQRGQYVGIRWNVPDLDHETTREYSLSKYPEDNEYRISVRHLNGGRVSSYIHSGLKVGSIIRVTPPAGQFTYREADNKPMVLFVGGIGITPLVSITDRALDNGREVIMFNSNKKIEHRPFTEWLKDLKNTYGDKFKLKEYFDGENENAPKGAIDELETRPLQPQDFDFIVPNKYDVYMLGPGGYMKFVKSQLIKRGVEESEIATEFFGPVEV